MKRQLTVILTVTMAGSLLAGCSSNSNSEAPASSAQPSAAVPIKLSYWVPLSADITRTLKNYGESLFFQELEKKTNVKVDFQHPALGTENEQFNLLVASGNLPDVIERDFTTYPGGPEKAIADKVVIKLNDIIDKNAPNLKKYLAEHPDIKREISTDDGSIYVFPGIGIGNNAVSAGMVLRRDWLDELKLEVPVTMDDWTNVLRQFKEKKNVKAPLTMRLTDFSRELFNGAYGIGWSFYQENGKVKYGPYEANYKNYLAQLNSWYKEGLLDPDFATQDAKSLDAKAVNGTSGAFHAFIGSGMGKYLNAAQGTYDLVGAPYPVLRKGEEPRFINKPFDYRGGGSAGITPANKYPAETAKWLDYLYSNEGHMLKSFGVEGLTYTMVNGYPKYTDLIMNNPDKLSVGEAMAKYLRVNAASPGFVGDDRYIDQYYPLKSQKDASITFSRHQKNAEAILLPRVTPTAAEASELSTILSEVKTYQSEMFLKFIMGVEPLANFDKYIAQMKSLKIERAIAIQQNALEQYNKRK
ncbi:extracellular solute-binding protein [Paenibacillus koleovorans]|uniref:extracellular solute-binding protein n=1 Tax=Paenibacillus koleovorans TaxID=121608 RepID=UPI0013E3F344|nr:extracellular solute-binding protein [Paenibacillus koleovorans]